MNTKTTNLILISILLLMLSVNTFIRRASGKEQLSISLYKPPKVDGIISSGEYPIVQFDSVWGKLYAVHDGSNIIFGIFLTNNCRGFDLLFNTGSLETTILSTSTIRYSINRSGVIEQYYGHFSNWIASNISDISFKAANKTGGWVVELAILLTSLTISPNTERKIGFAMVIYEKNINYSWPQNISFYNPSTWGIIYSPDNWATKNDICLEVFLDKEKVIAGSNITFIAIITNKGDAPIPDYHIRIWFDDQLIEDSTASSLGLKTPLEKTDRVRYERKIINAPFGNHTLKANVTGLGIYYDFDSKNNFGKKSFLAKYAKIEVSGIPGISVSLEGESQTIPEEGTVIFYSTVGVKKIKAEKVYNPSEGLRYVFIQWRNDRSVFNNPELTLNVNGDSSLTLEYRKEYFVNLSFRDRNNSPLKPSFYTCVFPNGTFYNGTLRSLWLTSGDLRIMSVSYAGLNVLDETKVYNIHGPKEISVSCNVLSGTIRIVDPFSTPISGAEISAIFLNNTRKTYVTDSNGMLSMNRVVGGRVKLTVSHMGYSMTAEVDFSKEGDITIRIPMSINIVLIIVVVISIVALTIFLKLFSNKIFRKKSERISVRREEYEFEEI
ncbi:MAG: hypothetical protein NZ873_00455 [Crenarchaeota archaeon]|nr:hypothetical protein [Thermoproteota archaeon]MDW8033618.1 hypothetical protein [Nitrososphaerota archaeon]